MRSVPLIEKKFSMPVGDFNSEEACQVAVSQNMKHMPPGDEAETLTVRELVQ